MRASRAENPPRLRRRLAQFHDLGLGCRPPAPSGSTGDRGLPGRRGRAPPARPARHLVAITAAHGSRTADTRAASIRETLAGIKRTHGTHQKGKGRRHCRPPSNDRGSARHARRAAQPRLAPVGVRRRPAAQRAGWPRCRGFGLHVGWLGGDPPTVEDRPGRRGTKAGCALRQPSRNLSVRTSQSWLSAAAITTGPVFREIAKADRIIDPYTDRKGRQRGVRLGDKAVALIVKRARRQRASIRRGTPLARCAPVCDLGRRCRGLELAIMATTGHRSVQMVRRISAAANCFARTPPRRSDWDAG